MKTDIQSRFIPAIELAFIALFVFMLYYNSLANGFSVDDFQFVVNNPAVHGFSWENLTRLFTSVPNQMEYLPVKDLTYSLDLALFGPDPYFLHLSNILWYVLAAGAFYGFLRKLLVWLQINAPLLPVAAALIFVAHPMHVASVASICQRKDLVSGVLVFAALHAYVHFRQTGRRGAYCGALLLFILALLSKATVIPVPFFIIALEAAVSAEERLPFWKRAALAVPFIAVVAVFIKVESFFLLQTGVLSQLYSSTVSPGIRVATALKATLYYLKLMIFPYPLLMIHDFGFAKKVITPAVVFFGIVNVSLLATIICVRKRFPLAALAGFWMLLTLLPVSGLIPSNTLIAERYLFLPLAGYAILLAWGGHVLAGKGKSSVRAVTAALAALLVFYSVLTVRRNPDWHDNLTLLLANARDLPGKAGIYYQIGSEYFAKGEIGNALEYLGRAKRINPLYEVHLSVHTAVLAYQSGNISQAKIDLDRIQHPFKFQVIEVNYLYGKISQAEGNLENAAIYYRNAAKSSIPIGLVKPADVADALKSLPAVKRP